MPAPVPAVEFTPEILLSVKAPVVKVPAAKMRPRLAKKRVVKSSRPRLHVGWKSRRNRLSESARSRERVALNHYIESELAAVFPEDATAVNAEQPELHALGQALEEESLGGDVYDAKTVETQVDVQLALELPPLEEIPYTETAGVLAQNDFNEIRASYEALSDPDFFTWKSPQELEPQLVKPSKPAKKKTRTTVSRLQTAQKVFAPRGQTAGKAWTAKAPPSTKSLVALATASAPAPVLDAREELASPTPAPTVIAAVPTLVASPSASIDPALLAPKQASLATRAPEVSAVPPVSTQALAAPARVATTTLSRDSYSSWDGKPFDTDLFGRVLVGKKLQNWLRVNRAHIELYLQPLHSRDPQLIRHLSFSYPQSSFRDEAKALVGRYELVAGIFRPSDIDRPYAELRYPEEVNALTARQHLKFHIDTETKGFSLVSKASGLGRKSQVFLSFFRGAQSNYDTPAVIPFAEVRVLGFPEFGVLKANKDGDLVLPPLQARSIKVEVRAKGYFRTFRTIPILNSDVHQPIYLGQKNQLLTMAFTLAGVPQVETLSQVIGRVFDPVTRNPLEGERVELLDHSDSRGSFFRFFADGLHKHMTAVTGFFSYFNVASAFRYIERPDSGKRTLRVNVRPASVYYLELGRGGMRSLRGRLVDPNGSLPVAGALVRLVGDRHFQTTSDSAGQFTIPGIDFQSEMIAVDVAADPKTYRLTRFTIPWNPRQTDSEKVLFMLQRRFIEESLASSQIASVGPNLDKLVETSQTGNLISGTSAELFDQNTGCLSVELWSLDHDKKMPPQHGPFPFRGTASPNLCLSKDRPGANFLHLPSGEYLLKWKNAHGETVGAQIDHIGMGRDSIAVN